MRNYLYILILTVLFTANCAEATAQSSNQRRISREELAIKQAKLIANELNFNEAETRQYINTYCSYQKEIWALGPRPKRDTSGMTDAEIKKNTKHRFEHSRKILEIREQYYQKYSKFLTQTQIEQAYELERKMMLRLARNRAH